MGPLPIKREHGSNPVKDPQGKSRGQNTKQKKKGGPICVAHVYGLGGSN